MTDAIRYSVRVEGVVQGVGFRPFVYSLATRLGLSGWVGNDTSGVFAEVEGPAVRVRDFLALLEQQPPPLARVDRVTAVPIPAGGSPGFAIAASDGRGRRGALVTADSATCADCLAELADPADRRFGYPFINCTNCGPRFTIVTGVPYDRQQTTMAGFAMCAACAAEYQDPANRRFHAQPVCCPACGPRLRLLHAEGAEAAGEPLSGAVRLLAEGAVIAVKGLGGYHLAADAGSEPAAAALRARKHREDKPFAIMAADAAAAAALCRVDEAGRTLLSGPQRPIVLLPRRPAAPVAGAVAPGRRELGVMLPYTPLHHLLLRQFGRSIVLTSGNVSDEPIAHVDADAFTRLAGIADAFLTHDRDIHVRADDSVARVQRGRPVVLRRSRGYAPQPLTVRRRFPRPVLACGAELKNTFCLAAGDRAVISHHIGDLENYETLRSYTGAIAHYQRIFGITPEVVAHDLHPEYLSTKYALELEGVELTGIQHHHAHIASCLADNDETGPVIGVALDGLGFGLDGALWGGEFLLADLADFERAAHLAPVPMPGGAAAIRQPWRMAASYLDSAFGGMPPAGLAVADRNAARWQAVRDLARHSVNAPLTSSAGRLFDAVAAMAGARDTISYEGQAAIELEQLADPADRGAYPVSITDGTPAQVRGADLVRAAAMDLLAGVAPGAVAARFHRGLAAAARDCCLLLRERSGLGAVALSGGVFQNQFLLEETAASLERAGFRVLTHSRVPPNDGGISLGQAVIAAARGGLRL